MRRSHRRESKGPGDRGKADADCRQSRECSRYAERPRIDARCCFDVVPLVVGSDVRADSLKAGVLHNVLRPPTDRQLYSDWDWPDKGWPQCVACTGLLHPVRSECRSLINTFPFRSNAMKDSVSGKSSPLESSSACSPSLMDCAATARCPVFVLVPRLRGGPCPQRSWP